MSRLLKSRQINQSPSRSECVLIAEFDGGFEVADRGDECFRRCPRAGYVISAIGLHFYLIGRSIVQTGKVDAIRLGGAVGPITIYSKVVDNEEILVRRHVVYGYVSLPTITAQVDAYFIPRTIRSSSH